MPHNSDVNSMIEEITDVAKQDGIITSEEMVLIDNIKENIRQYFDIIDKNYQDGVITAEEEHQFYESRKKIMEEALDTAKENNEVSQNEYRILRALAKVIDDMKENEHY